MERTFIALIVLLPILLANAGHALYQYPSWSGLLRPALVLDENPDPKIVEVTLTAQVSEVRFRPGDPLTEVWTYNGSTPGPLIRANLGDRLIVHFYNELPEPSTIHWHGLEVPADMDGSNISQLTVEPGGYFRYEFDLLRPALYWYHPHVRSSVQVEKGLYGALLVRDPRDIHELGLPYREHVLMLDDVLLDEQWQVAEELPTDPLLRAERRLNGREGNTLLVNGRADAVGLIQPGVPHRLRLVNASNARFMRFTIPGHQLWRIGGDGGLLEEPIQVLPIEGFARDDDPLPGFAGGGILLTPGERADVVFTPRGKVVLEWHDIARGRHTVFYKDDGTIGISHPGDDGNRPPLPLVRLNTLGIAVGTPSATEYVPPAQLRDIAPMIPDNKPPVPVIFGHSLPDENGDVVFFVVMKDGVPMPFSILTAADAPMVEVGERRVFEVHNLTGGDHNFHIHGFMFQAVETEFVDLDTPANNFIVPTTHLEDKDTVYIPRRPGPTRGRSRTITRIVVHFDDTGREGQVLAQGKVPDDKGSGGWLYHCHLLEHSAAGMMGFVQVRAAD